MQKFRNHQPSTQLLTTIHTINQYVRIAIVGAGVIGASWAAEYLARGFDVVVTDPAPNAESQFTQIR